MGMLRAAVVAESVLVLVLLLPALPPAKAAVFTEFINDADHPGTCPVRVKGIRVKNGYEWDLPDCMKAACYGSANDMFIQYYTCGSIGAPPGCFVIQDMDKPYPECCGDISCPPKLPRAERSARHLHP